MLFSPPVPRLGRQAQQAPRGGSPQVLTLLLEAIEDGPFAPEMSTTATLSGGAISSLVVSAAAETASSQSRKEPSDFTLPVEAKETKLGGRPMKEQM